MPLIKSPTLTAAKLAANRLNARKSTGPRTHRGKCRVTLNALKHGRYASRFFRSHLTRNRAEVELYDWFYRQICRNLCPGNKRQWQDAEQVACGVWCFFRAVGQEGFRRGLKPPTTGSVWCLLRIPTRFTQGRGTNPRYAVKSTDAFATFPSQFNIPLGRTGVRLRFWTRRRPRPPFRRGQVLGRALVPRFNPCLASWPSRLWDGIRRRSKRILEYCGVA